MTKPTNQPPLINKNLILLSLFFLFILFMLLNQKSPFLHPNTKPYSSFLSSCRKIPRSLSESIVHYATTTTTPQQALEEISLSWRVLDKISPCNFLVFGVGHDSPMWTALNHGGRTVFLEGAKSWMELVHKQMPSLEIHHVVYDTNVSQAKKLYDIGKSEPCQVVTDPRLSECPLVLKNLPSEVYETEWDVIMVDAPDGYMDESPGRMKAIYTAALWAKNRRAGETHVFVHDIQREVENYFSKAFLCKSYLSEQARLMRHFVVPAHTNSDRPFCP